MIHFCFLGEDTLLMLNERLQNNVSICASSAAMHAASLSVCTMDSSVCTACLMPSVVVLVCVVDEPLSLPLAFRLLCLLDLDPVL